MRVVELGDGARFAVESLPEQRGGGERPGEDLDRDGAAETRIAGL
jgi:hypothetical protein